MKDLISVLLVGIGGYGKNYFDELANNTNRSDYQIAAVVDPYAEKSPKIKEVRGRGIPVFSKMEDFYQEHTADYVCISSPIQFHASQTVIALDNGAGVICEKPLSATVQEGRKMLEAERESDRPVGIAYQWSFSQAIQLLKKDIIAGVFGKPLRLKTLVSWPRDIEYYKRNNWAGKKRDSGQWILDSVANNATAHYLHNMFYVLGKEIEKSAWPVKLRAELYRANDIDNYDTAAVRVFTEQGVELLYLATHASQEKINPRFSYEFEQAIIYFDQDKDCQIKAEFKDGRNKVYGDPFADKFNKIWTVLDAIKGEGSYLCGVEAALPHVICVNGMQESLPEISNFPNELIEQDRDEDGRERGVYVKGLSKLFLDCYNNWQLPDETEVHWTELGKEVDLTAYEYFPSGNYSAV
ncbi:Gfo/Idh/MocA family oxidoreductase [Halocella sp. SP3-1]|uniref:Gfo/Idh/MocA family protein n=1 Tax=Halocella sp. SP3-1 TaxID=2382161 RepID=UPI000F759B48|nr:Gfo/Idh/MocA family oxidoreductase [Halocella sp. SP3-1]AZO94393.1 gfo/Idh/MocA family oxidoreductase [Halocella sp. SP3-1]